MHGALEDTAGCGNGLNTHSILRSASSRSKGKGFSIGSTVDFYPFDEEYVRRLRAGEPEVEEHFSLYFQERLHMKLRVGRYQAADADDMIQDIFLRTLRTIQADGLRDAKSLGAFVYGICRNICHEQVRGPRRMESPLPEGYLDDVPGPDDPERDLLDNERRREVQRVIREMDAKDRDLLNAYYIDERPKDEICKMFGVTRGYLRVCLHRVKKALKRRYLKKFDAKHKPNTMKKDD